MLSNYDQPIRMSKDDAKIFEDVDDVISRSVMIGDPSLAIEYGSRLRQQQQIQGLALAKLLYRIKQSWNLYRSGGIDDEMESVIQTEMGISPETTNKYIRMWTSIFENDGVEDGIKQLLMGRPIGDLLLLTAAVREGDLQGEELKDAALAPDQKTLKDIIRQKRGEHTSSKNAVRICLAMTDSAATSAGTIYAMQGDVRAMIGFFYKPESELAEKAMARIVQSAGIVEVY